MWIVNAVKPVHLIQGRQKFRFHFFPSLSLHILRGTSKILPLRESPRNLSETPVQIHGGIVVRVCAVTTFRAGKQLFHESELNLRSVGFRAPPDRIPPPQRAAPRAHL